MMIRAVAFDAFCTLVRIGERRSPYRQLMRWMRDHGRPPDPGDAIRILTMQGGLSEIASSFGWRPPIELLAKWETDLADELQSIQPYDDVKKAMARLRDGGYRIGLCSNLAAPYGRVLRDRLPAFDAYAMSFEVGAVKPDPPIYRHLVQQLDCHVAEVLFVGDTVLADLDGPQAYGMQARLIDRASGQLLDEVLFGLTDLHDGKTRGDGRSDF